MDRPSLDNLARLDESAGFDLAGFDCGNPDLNEFLTVDALDYLHQLFAVSYLIPSGSSVAAFFSLSNDRLAFDQTPAGKKARNRVSRTIPNEKRRSSYPAVKLGRLGVDRKYKRQGLGSEILSFLKVFFVDRNKTGCRFIIVDAYNDPETVKFYQKNAFEFLFASDEDEKTRLMYFDLKPFHDFHHATKSATS